jgi:predicted phosphodiesterase
MMSNVRAVRDMTRVALISDLHANEVALQAVLRAIRRTGVDQIICLGDVATLGPAPNGVLEILSALGCPCIMGNHDEFLLDPTLVDGYRKAPRVTASIAWTRDRLSRAELDFIRGFERGSTLSLGGGATMQLFHGSPRSNTENLLASTSAQAVDEMLDGAAAILMAGGHTHVQMLRQHHGNLLVNPGSVGLPFRDYVGGGTPTILSHAEFAQIDAVRGHIEVRLRRIALDKTELRQAQTDHPLRPWLLEQYH